MTDREKRSSDIRSEIYRIIRIGYVGDVPSRIFDIVIATSILINLFIIFFETFDVSARYIGILSRIELVTVVIFSVEYVLRLFTADLEYPDKKPYAAALFAFIFSLYGIVDLVSFLPYWIMKIFPAAAIPSGVVAFRMLRVVRILRLFRINRYYDAFNVITDVIREKKNQIASAVFIILMLVIASSILMYNLEHDVQPDNFKNAFSGVWWAVSALLTVGYGDIYPITPAGRFVGIILAFLGVGIVAIPTGILSAGFVQQYTMIKDIEGTIDENPLDHIVLLIQKDHIWCQKRIGSISIPEGMKIAAVLRGNESIRAYEDEIIREGDRLVIETAHHDTENMLLGEVWISKKSEWVNTSVSELESALGVTCTCIRRDSKILIPQKDTVINGEDTVVVLKRNDVQKGRQK